MSCFRIFRIVMALQVRLGDILPTPDEMGSLLWCKHGDGIADHLGIAAVDLLAIVRAVVPFIIRVRIKKV